MIRMKFMRKSCLLKDLNLDIKHTWYRKDKTIFTNHWRLLYWLLELYKQWRFWTKGVRFCLHLSSYCKNLILLSLWVSEPVYFCSVFTKTLTALTQVTILNTVTNSVSTIKARILYLCQFYYFFTPTDKALILGSHFITC